MVNRKGKGQAEREGNELFGFDESALEQHTFQEHFFCRGNIILKACKGAVNVFLDHVSIR